MSVLRQAKSEKQALWTPPEKLQRQLELFSIRASQVAEHVFAGRLLMADAVETLHDAAEASGLYAACGYDQIQKLLAAAFESAAQDPPS